MHATNISRNAGCQITNLPNRGIETQIFKGNGYATSKCVRAMK
jgi:hypothetical protein